jgi:hypothetical protein
MMRQLKRRLPWASQLAQRLVWAPWSRPPLRVSGIVNAEIAAS